MIGPGFNKSQYTGGHEEVFMCVPYKRSEVVVSLTKVNSQKLKKKVQGVVRHRLEIKIVCQKLTLL